MSRRSTPPQRGTTGDDNAATPSAQQWRRLGQVFVRHVTAGNLVVELSMIRSLLETHPYVTVHADHHGGDEEGYKLPPAVRIDDLPAASRYGLAKVDVDTPTPYSQLGITLCDANGRLPRVQPCPGAAAVQSLWQVALHGRDSVSVSGCVSLSAFAYRLFATGVVSSAGTPRRGTPVTWVAYGGLYHLGFLLKVLTGGARLPNTLRAYLGDRVFDGRYVAGAVSLKGPLTLMGSLLGAPAAAAMEPGKRSLVACEVFMRLKGLFFAWDSIDVHAGCIHGLHSPTTSWSSTGASRILHGELQTAMLDDLSLALSNVTMEAIPRGSYYWQA